MSIFIRKILNEFSTSIRFDSNEKRKFYFGICSNFSSTFFTCIGKTIFITINTIGSIIFHNITWTRKISITMWTWKLILACWMRCILIRWMTGTDSRLIHRWSMMFTISRMTITHLNTKKKVIYFQFHHRDVCFDEFFFFRFDLRVRVTVPSGEKLSTFLVCVCFIFLQISIGNCRLTIEQRCALHEQTRFSPYWWSSLTQCRSSNAYATRDKDKNKQRISSTCARMNRERQREKEQLCANTTTLE